MRDRMKARRSAAAMGSLEVASGPWVCHSLDVWAAVRRARFPWYLAYVQRHFKGQATAVRVVLLELLFCGRGEWGKLMENIQEIQEKEDLEDPHDEEALLAAFKALVDARLVERAPPLLYEEPERDENFGTAKGSKKALDEADLRRRHERAARHARQRFVVGARAGDGPPPGVMWCVNWAEFDACHAVELTVDLVERYAGAQYVDEEEDEMGDGVRDGDLSVEAVVWRELARREPRAAFLPELAEQAEGLHGDDEEEDGLSGSAMTSTARRATAGQLQAALKASHGYSKEKVSDALKRLLAMHPPLVREHREFDGPLLFKADVSAALRTQRMRHIGSVIKSTFSAKGGDSDSGDKGELAFRITNLLLGRGRMELKQIQDTAMMKTKDARQLLYRMLREGFLSMDELQRGSERQPNRSFFLWHVSEDQLVERVSRQCLVTLVALYRAERALWEGNMDVVRAIDSNNLLGVPTTSREHIRVIAELTPATDTLTNKQLDLEVLLFAVRAGWEDTDKIVRDSKERKKAKKNGL